MGLGSVDGIGLENGDRDGLVERVCVKEPDEHCSAGGGLDTGEKTGGLENGVTLTGEERGVLTACKQMQNLVMHFNSLHRNPHKYSKQVYTSN